MPDFTLDQSIAAPIEKGGGRVDDESELRIMLQRLTRTNHALKRVVLVTGHDLQEPIRTIYAYCERLLADSTAPDALQPILDCVARSREIVQALLSYCVMTGPKEFLRSDTCFGGSVSGD